MANNYFVYAERASLPNERAKCIVVNMDEDVEVVATYYVAFGPASKVEAERWVRDNCEISSEEDEAD